MATNNQSTGSEDNDLNKEPHDPVHAGKQAIEAGKIASGDSSSKDEQGKEDKADAEKWRNEG